MLEITIPSAEFFDERTQEFVNIKGRTLRLEHSLISLSKWESKWCRAFLTKKEKTVEETMDYVRCMTIDSNVDPLVYRGLTQANVEEIKKYIDAPMTATHFRDDGRRGASGSETITSELIYYWMVALQIPFECQRWHLNRLLTLIRVCNMKNAPSKKMTRNSVYQQNAALNAARRQKMRSRG